MRNVVPASFVLLFVSACGYSVSYTETNTPPRRLAARQASSVEVFTVAPPDRAFVEVGLFEIEQQSEMSGSGPAMVKHLREEAAKVGCDAVLITGNTQRIQSASSMHHGTVSGSSFSGTSQHHVSVVRGQRAACIVYRDAEPQPAQAQPQPPSASATQL